ncbi:MAG: hypothetical protein JOZ09_15255 [Pseudonocardiales bacterium]|nr:hypothetical protein [Pseudonocardiales bacterium]
MRMRIYAEQRGRAARQVLADLLVVIWVVLVVEVARAAFTLIVRLQGPGEGLKGAGAVIHDAFQNAARSAVKAPIIGDGLARAFNSGARAGDSLASSGRALSETISTLAVGTAVAIVLLGALPPVLVWLTLRIRWITAARSALAVRAIDVDLLALRALTRRPMQQLVNICPDPAAAWRRDDRAALRKLAALELRTLGLREPSQNSD